MSKSFKHNVHRALFLSPVRASQEQYLSSLSQASLNTHQPGMAAITAGGRKTAGCDTNANNYLWMTYTARTWLTLLYSLHGRVTTNTWTWMNCKQQRCGKTRMCRVWNAEGGIIDQLFKLVRVNTKCIKLYFRFFSITTSRKMCIFQGYFSRTFQDLKPQFPELSRTKVIFQDFPGPGILKKKNPGLSMTFQEAWEPCQWFFF